MKILPRFVSWFSASPPSLLPGVRRPGALHSVFLAVLSVLVGVGQVGAASISGTGVMLFDDPTDTIAVSGQTVFGSTATYEARVLFTEVYNDAGYILHEFTGGYEDKRFWVGTSGLSAFSFPVNRTSDAMDGSASVSLGQWHHFAYVYDGTQERLYFDGTLVASRSGSGAIANGSAPAFIGAMFRNGFVRKGIVGYLDTLRFSNTARYHGASFTPPTGDLPADAATQLLYNFNDSPGSETVADEGPYGRVGLLGTGFSQATSPRLVAAPDASTHIELLRRGSSWDYLDRIKNELSPAGPLDYPTDAAGRTWYDPEFDVGTSADRSRTPPVDLFWQNGAAPLGNGTITGEGIATRLQGIDDAPNGTSNDVTTYLFRREFELPDSVEIQELRLYLLSDDGGTLYINGQEVFRTPTMPDGPVATTTSAESYGSEFFHSFTIDRLDVLRAGTNSIAYELHQGGVTSSDIGFDLELNAIVVPKPSTVVGRHVFYNNSAFDGDDPLANAADDAAIATDKSALSAGEPASFENYTNFDGGINGIIVDVDRPNASSSMRISDFEFRVGNNDDPGTWGPAPAISGGSVRIGEGVDGSDRVTIVWPSGAIVDQWLEVTVKANDNTGLEADDVFYFGNAVGDTGNSAFIAVVDDADLNNIGANYTDPAGIENVFDVNRDGRVDPVDAVIVRSNFTAGGVPMTMLWNPVPEPTAFILAVCGLTTLGLVGRRRR